MNNVTEVSAQQLYQELSAGKDVFVLDLRSPSEFADWKVEGRNPAQYRNIHYSRFLEDEAGAASELPKDQEITVVCAKGGSSLVIAEMLAEMGYTVRHLVGGMLAWSQLHVAEEIPTARPEFRFWQINRVGKGCLSYLIASGNDALLVDPSRMVDSYLNLAQDAGVTIRYVIDTHVHADHISGSPRIAHMTGAEYYMSPTMPDSVLSYKELQDGSVFQLGSVSVKVLTIHTPGHTPESTCLLVNDQYLLSGDTLFVQSIGRPDLGGKAEEWARDLYNSVHHQLGFVADSVLVLPAHYSGVSEIGPDGLVSAQLGSLRRQNAALSTTDQSVFMDLVLKDVSPTTPPNYEAITRINVGLQKVEEDEATELEIGPNRCAVAH